ncbi:pyridoxamine 5'-phosphate oxidase family protein [Myxococcus qinghaiensis]|uniref:pyridoxamine 5'-phosphate oxidase family protein n=1 Tax=Myxococcus qinghaiensis TaxID=2906758 RepID=UPI0020A7A0A3|nr:pyridoxamine 5'-phosphate oxidase family protein [Myxococcus qinghaiensis]MCP3168533.1 pyridoxamine 5'-phosphate oxidase family protein [Myxococcus qinghaiensis]
MSQVQTVEALEQLVGSRPLGVMMKSRDALDEHCVRLLAVSSFVVMGYVDVDGHARATAAGGPHGFARVVDSTHLCFELADPIALNPTVGCGLLFFVPGLGETLRVNGTASVEGTTLRFTVEETFVHCAKAILRSSLWKPAAATPPPATGMAPGPVGDVVLRDWLARTPFVVLASWDAQGRADTSPKGDPAGFLRLDGTRLAVADRPGNRRTDTFHNVIEQPRVALLALIPGEARALEFSGVASLTTEPALLESMAVANKVPKIALSLDFSEARLSSGRAITDAGLWDTSRHVPASQLPKMSDVFVVHVKRSAQTGAAAATVRALVSKRLMSWGLSQDYKKNLY